MSSNGKAYGPANSHPLSYQEKEISDPNEGQQHLACWIKRLKALTEAEP